MCQFLKSEKIIVLPIDRVFSKSRITELISENHYPTLKFPLNNSTFCQRVALDRIMFTLSMWLSKSLVIT